MTRGIAQKIVWLVNKELPLVNQISDNFTFDTGNIIGEDRRGRRVAVVCYGGGPNPIVRSVIRERRAGKGFSWLCNGQAGKNAVEVKRWDESHRYQPTAADMVEYFDSSGRAWVGLLKKGAYVLPLHLTVEDVLKVAEIIPLTA